MFLLLLTLIRCGCPEPGVFYYNWNGMDISYNRYVVHEDGSATPWATDDTVFHGTTFGLQVLMQTQLVVKAEYKIDFSNSAFAWSKCEPDVYKPQKLINDFNIYTLNDFDEYHLKNSDITAYFYSGNINETNTLYYLNNDDPNMYKVNDFRLNKLPTMGSIHKFKIEFILEDGTKLTSETKEITLLPEK